MTDLHFGKVELHTIVRLPPTFVPPQLPTTPKAPPDARDWLHEPKWDGCRFQIIKNGRDIGASVECH